MSRLPALLRTRHLLWLLFAALLSMASARAETRLVLADGATDLDGWPAVGWLVDADGSLGVEQVSRDSRGFEPPPGPHANLGVRHEVVWLRLPVQVAPGDDGRWLLDIDYPSLDRVDVHVVTRGEVVAQARLGDGLTHRERPGGSRSLMLPLALEPGVEHELLLRVQTRSTMIVPLRLMKPEAYHARETRLHLWQGLATGLALCLVAYALANWAATRDTMFAWYGLATAGPALFFFAYYGLAPRFLWPEHAWLTDNAAPLAVLLGLVGGFLLIERLLDIRSLWPRLALLLQVLSGIAGVTALLFASGLLSYRAAHLVSTVLGPLPMALAVPVAWVRWRRGDPAASWLFLGWGVYALGVVVMVSLLRGWAPSNEWTQHAFQVGSTFEMLTWLRVLGLRNDEARRRAEQADRERAVLHSLAHTDALTGLPNRRGLQHQLAAAARESEAGRLLAVCLVDLDGFKAVNDTFGHDAGDSLLRAVAVRLREQLRQRDVVARLGGDEFVVLVRDLASEQVAWQVGRKLVAAFDAPFVVDGRECRVGLTLGFALAPLDGMDADTLLKRADAAMYAGKQSGKGTVRRGAASVGLAAG